MNVNTAINANKIPFMRKNPYMGIGVPLVSESAVNVHSSDKFVSSKKSKDNKGLAIILSAASAIVIPTAISKIASKVKFSKTVKAFEELYDSKVSAKIKDLTEGLPGQNKNNMLKDIIVDITGNKKASKLTKDNAPNINKVNSTLDEFKSKKSLYQNNYFDEMNDEDVYSSANEMFDRMV